MKIKLEPIDFNCEVCGNKKEYDFMVNRRKNFYVCMCCATKKEIVKDND
jgi:hypothetical protein